MKVGLVQYEFKNNDIDFNFAQIRKAVSLSKGKADLLCFGETFLQGFDSLSWDFSQDKSIGVSFDSKIIGKIKELSKENGVDLLFGYIELDGSSLYSSCVLIEKGEVKHNYRRISKNWKEASVIDSHYCEGTQSEEFTYKHKNMKIALCGDLWVCPEHFKTSGILIWPIYCNFSEERWLKCEQYEYAKQSLVASNDVLMVSSLTKQPLSVGGTFYFKNGKIEKAAAFNVEEILFVEL